MEKPTECRWCGCGDVFASTSDSVMFLCRSHWKTHDLWGSPVWIHSSECSDGLRDRIRRSIDTLKAATRYTVTPGPRNTLDWDRNPDGSVTDSVAVDEALAILEGERDEAT